LWCLWAIMASCTRTLTRDLAVGGQSGLRSVSADVHDSNWTLYLQISAPRSPLRRRAGDNQSGLNSSHWRERRDRTATPRMTRAGIAGISPFFIVADVVASLSFYRDMLDFEVVFQEPAEDPFFAIVRRDGAMVMVKSVGVEPLPNCEREPQARWDAYLNVPDPDALATEFASRGVTFSVPLKDTHDGLRGFELKDVDGYVLFFGRPRT
jgi:catechol 2,3-dioxygenase-like lactoylglutathione lyase family enzyme